MRRIPLSTNEFDQMLKEQVVLSRGLRSFVALNEKDNQIIKMFALGNKKSFWRQYISPISNRFMKNARRLAELNVQTIQPCAWYRCKGYQYDVIVYPQCAGTSIYDLVEKNHDVAPVLEKLARYIAELHQRKIYFRAGHGGNYLYTGDEKFSLIDVDNTRFSINLRRRAKNIVYIYQHSKESKIECFAAYPFSEFVETYFSVAKLKKKQEQKVRFWIEQYLAAFEKKQRAS